MTSSGIFQQARQSPFFSGTVSTEVSVASWRHPAFPILLLQLTGILHVDPSLELQCTFLSLLLQCQGSLELCLHPSTELGTPCFFLRLSALLFRPACLLFLASALFFLLMTPLCQFFQLLLFQQLLIQLIFLPTLALLRW